MVTAATDKGLKRELFYDGTTYIVTLTTETIEIREKGKHKGHYLRVDEALRLASAMAIKPKGVE